MLKYIGHFVGWLLLGGNALMVVLMLVCAYSPYIDPIEHSLLACTGLAFPVFLTINLLYLLFWVIFYRKYALLSLLGILLCWGAVRDYIPLNCTQKKEIPEDAIKLLSYNVMAYEHDKPHTKEEPNRILEYLANSDADIICTQEAIVNTSKRSQFLTDRNVREALKDYPYYARLQEERNAWECFSRYPILSKKKIDYVSRSNGSVAYEIKIGNDTLLLINNHLESNKLTSDDKAVYKEMITDPEKEKVKSGFKQLFSKIASAMAIRASQADSVAKYIRNSPHQYVVVCGDFNDSPISYTHKTIGESLKDAFVESGCGLGISYNQNGFYFRIDHILVSNNWDVFNCIVDKSLDNSDHYPIWCYLKKQ